MNGLSDEISRLLLAVAEHLHCADLIGAGYVVHTSARGVGEGLLNTQWELRRAGFTPRPIVRIDVVRLHELMEGSGMLQVRVVYDDDLNPALWRTLVVELATTMRDGHGTQIGGLGQYSLRQWAGFMWYAPARAAFRMALVNAFRHGEPTIEIVEECKLPD